MILSDMGEVKCSIWKVMVLCSSQKQASIVSTHECKSLCHLCASMAAVAMGWRTCYSMPRYPCNVVGWSMRSKLLWCKSFEFECICPVEFSSTSPTRNFIAIDWLLLAQYSLAAMCCNEGMLTLCWWVWSSHELKRGNDNSCGSICSWIFLDCFPR